MREVIGFDSYNLCPTGDVSKTLQAERADNEHLAMVFIGENMKVKAFGFDPGAARTSNAREVNSMCEVIGVDMYNQAITGDVSMSMRATRGDTEHIPCVLIGEEDGTD